MKVSTGARTGDPDASPPSRAERTADDLAHGRGRAGIEGVEPRRRRRTEPGDLALGELPRRGDARLAERRATGVPLSVQQGRRVALPLADALPLALMPSDRARLHAAIAQRFDAMLAAGLVDELAALRRRFDLRPELPAMRAVGYRQAWCYLEGAIDRAAFREAGIAATRQLAKRQMTWLRATTATRFDPFEAGAATAVREVIGRALGA